MDLAITLGDSADAPLHDQLYKELRRSIMLGRLSPGQRLPSTRVLASSLKLSRATVIQSFAQLLSEGYLEARRGSGTYVSAQLPDELARSLPPEGVERARSAVIELSEFGEELRAAAPLEPRVPANAINFRDGRPAFDRFPIETWRKLVARHSSATAAMLDYTPDPAGHRPLREAIARYLSRARAVRCSADNIVMVGGSQQAIDLASRLLIDRGDAVAVEEPGYPGARRNFVAQGARLVPIAVDEQGLRVEELFGRAAQAIRLIYVTPSHQFPTGATLPLRRRIELLRWAHRLGAIVLEDDYDSAYRYAERPIPALQGLDEAGCVIYIGTFSKVLFPALRLGYVVVPKGLVDVFVRAKAYSDRQSPLIDQYALADFIDEGHFERHLRRMRGLYERRRAALVAELEKTFGDAIAIRGESAGMHLLARFSLPIPNDEAVSRAAREGVSLTNAQPLYLGSGGEGEFVFGFAELDEDRIAEGVRRLARAFGVT
jgi:GntR family transcriptional regulator/MocR family aminotransferase